VNLTLLEKLRDFRCGIQWPAGHPRRLGGEAVPHKRSFCSLEEEVGHFVARDRGINGFARPFIQFDGADRKRQKGPFSDKICLVADEPEKSNERAVDQNKQKTL
jgi:hypothetical protein